MAPEDFCADYGSTWVGNAEGVGPINVGATDPSWAERDTLSPFGRAFYEGQASYSVYSMSYIVLYSFTWTAVCSIVHNAPVLVSMFLIFHFFQLTKNDVLTDAELFYLAYCAYIPVNMLFVAASLATDIGAKWWLIGRRVKGSYSWDQNEYCQNWQLYLVLSKIKKDILPLFQGSQYLVWYFRALGSSIGKDVCLYPNGGDPMMTEPDLVTIKDGASIDDSSVVAHINTRGVFK